MPIFKAPQYSKITNPKTRVQEPSYTFAIEFQSTDEGLSFVAESVEEISLKSLQKCVLDNITWWNTFITGFLQASAKLFSKPYTVETINKITRHTLDVSISSDFPATITLIPKSIQIFGGTFTVNWGYTSEPLVINIPDLTEPEISNKNTSLPVSNTIVEGIQELNIDELPVGSNSTEEALELDSPAKFYEKQRVKEARLKAKLAIYKAQRQMAQYYEKYGDDISDSDSEFDTSDEESHGASGEEEVQL
jgi:hypothetical protein